MRRIPLLAIQSFIILKLFVFCYAQDSPAALRPAYVNADNINLRCDSTVNSPVICSVGKGERVEIVSEKYNWYKINLPKKAPSFVSKTLVELINEKTARGLKNNINIRMAPDSSSPILGEINKNEIINILQDLGQWYKIEPTVNSYGWIHKKFVSLDKTKTEDKPKILSSEESKPKADFIVIEGIIRPYGRVINRIATHKLITKDNDIFLLKGAPASLNALTYHKVKITGKSIPSPKQKYPAIEIIKMEVLN